MSTTAIKRADWVIAWNESQSRHEYLCDADVVFDDDRISFVGKDYNGSADREISGRGRMVMPGFVNIHSHPASEPFNRGLMEERGSPRLGMSSLYEFMLLVRPDEDARRAAALFAVSELLKSGVTTFVDYSATRAGWIDDLAASGIRACLAPSYRSARWFTRNGHRVEYEWSEAAGREAMAAGLDVIDAASRHESGRLFGMLAPAQVDTCTAELLQASVEAAKTRNAPLQIHASQSVVEFREMTARHGKTPLEWLDGLGVLYDGAIIAHCIFVDEHSWIRWPRKGDLERMVRSGASVAHCPLVFARRGNAMESLHRFRAAGINVGLGTDTYPRDLISEMRLAALLCKVVEHDFAVATSADVFSAATLGGAQALRRDDLGRLAPGAKADVVLIAMRSLRMGPYRDPIRALVQCGTGDDVRRVIVDGRTVVEGGHVVGVDEGQVLAEAQREAERLWAEVREWHWEGLSADEVSSPSFAALGADLRA